MLTSVKFLCAQHLASTVNQQNVAASDSIATEDTWHRYRIKQHVLVLQAIWTVTHTPSCPVGAVISLRIPSFLAHMLCISYASTASYS